MSENINVDEYYDEILSDGISTGFSYNTDSKVETNYQKSSKSKSSKSTEINPDLRVINDYFKDVAKESLLTPFQEISVSAEIAFCEKRIKQIRTTGHKMNGAVQRKNGRKVVKSGFTPVYKRKLILNSYIRKSNELRNRFVKSNLRLVASMAKRFSGRGVPFMDLIQEGNIGLIKAVEKFDHTKGYRFSTYACWWINQAMTRGIFNQTRTVKIPAYVLEQVGKVKEVKSKLYEEMGREPLAEEIANNGKLSTKSVKRVLEAEKKTLTLDSPVWEGENSTYLDFIADSRMLSADNVIDEISIPKNLDEALLWLNTREREILKMRFGIGYSDSYTLDEIGKKFNLTRERIRQIEKKALIRLRKSKYSSVLRSLIQMN